MIYIVIVEVTKRYKTGFQRVRLGNSVTSLIYKGFLFAGYLVYYFGMSGENNKLTDRQQLFVEAYLIDPNAKQAAIHAGYSKHSAEVTGCKTLRIPKVANAIAAGRANREEKSNIDAAWVLTNLAAMIQADPSDIIDKDTGAYLRIHDWPLVWRRMLSAADVKELYGYNEDGDRERIGEIVKYKFIDKLKAFELLGKHVDVSAFAERLDVRINDDLADRISRGRNRTEEDEQQPVRH